MSDVRFVTATLCAEAGRLSSAMVSSESTTIPPSRKAFCGFVILSIVLLLESRIRKLLPATLRPRNPAATSFPQSIEKKLSSCLGEVTVLSKLVNNLSREKDGVRAAFVTVL
jgi:hypothetical protein